MVGQIQTYQKYIDFYGQIQNPDIWDTITGCLCSLKQVKIKILGASPLANACLSFHSSEVFLQRVSNYNAPRGGVLNPSYAIKYKTLGKEVVSRVLDPYHGVRYGGDWYVVGYCYLRDDVRTFSLSRIVKAETTGETILIPDDFDFKQLSGSHFGIHWSDGEVDVELRFSKRVADYVTERMWHPSQRISTCQNGDVKLSMTVNHLLELKRWVLSWGVDVKVLEPDYFGKDIERTLKQAMECY